MRHNAPYRQQPELDWLRRVKPLLQEAETFSTDTFRVVVSTVVRALESAARATGEVQPGHGYTRLHITAAHVLKTVDGLLTGLHEPEASHLDLLTAFLPAEQIRVAYEEAVQRRYLWHEFGDLNLIV